jgi:hypothetical protein
MRTAIFAALIGACAAGLASLSGGERTVRAEPARTYVVSLQQLSRDGQNPASQSSFSTSAQVTRDGGAVKVTATVRATKASTAVVDVEIYGPNGRVAQEWFDNSSLPANQSRSFTTTWQVPGNAVLGDYTVKIGLFEPGSQWQTLYHWNDSAATFSLP